MVRLFAFLLSLFLGNKGNGSGIAPGINPIAKKVEDPIRFEGLLIKRPEWMAYDTYRSIRKAQNKKLKLYLRNKQYNGYMGYSVNAYNTPYTL